MLKFVDVVTHMQQNSENINIHLLFPKSINWKQWQQYTPDELFSDAVIEYLNALSVSLLKNRQSRLYPDVITFAFFCRKSNLVAQKAEYLQDKHLRLGRGILFHVAPSNVPINFGYSLIAGLLSGNYNVVRVSSKEYPQVDLIVEQLLTLSEQDAYKNVSDRIALVKYDRDSNATAFFSSFCDVRVIWGGDATIAQIRKSTIPPRSFDLTFADRYSIAVIQADEMVKADSTILKMLAEDFYNDTYLFDQNACSAPHLIVWLGEKRHICQSQERFWNTVQEVVARKYEFRSVLAVDKLTTFYCQAVNMPIEKKRTKDNRLVRVNLKRLDVHIDDYRCAGGYFSEYVAENLNEIVPIIKNKYQTMAYYGFVKEDLERFVMDNHLIGIDRIVPFGKTTGFALIWDGYNLIDMLSRKCSII